MAKLSVRTRIASKNEGRRSSYERASAVSTRAHVFASRSFFPVPGAIGRQQIPDCPGMRSKHLARRGWAGSYRCDWQLCECITSAQRLQTWQEAKQGDILTHPASNEVAVQTRRLGRDHLFNRTVSSDRSSCFQRCLGVSAVAESHFCRARALLLIAESSPLPTVVSI